MGLAEEVYHAVKPLPEAMVQEVLDFALFLRQRRKSLMFTEAESVTDCDNAENNEWSTAEFTEMSMRQAMRDIEDEPSLYHLKDLKERW